MPDLPYGGGSQQGALAEGVMAFSDALFGLAKRQKAAADVAQKALISSGVAAEYLKAKQIIDTNYINFLSSLRLDPDARTFKERYTKEMQSWIIEARQTITLPGAMQKLDEYLASESGLKAQQEGVATFTDNRVLTEGEKLIRNETNRAVATGDFTALETLRDDKDIGVYHSESDIVNFNDNLIPAAKYNSVYNKLSTLDPDLSLSLLGKPEDAKKLGVDLSVLTPEQLDAMTKQIQLERDYSVAQRQRAEAKVIGDSDNKMLDAEIALLTGTGDPSTWLSPSLVDGQQWPGEEGARKAKYWLDALKSDLNFLKEDTVDTNLDALYAIAFDPNKGDQQKKDEIRVYPGISGEDRAKVMNVVNMREQNPAYYRAAQQVEDAFKLSMGIAKTSADVKALARESVRAQRQLEDLWLKNHGNITLLNQNVDRILAEVKTADLGIFVEQDTGVAPGFASGEWRPEYKKATQFEYLREQGKLPAGAITDEMIKKAHQLELDMFKNSKMPTLSKFYTVTAEGTYVYSSQPIKKDKVGNIIISKDVPLYVAQYQIKPVGNDKFDYVPTIYKMNLSTYEFDIAVWEQK